MNWQKLSIKQFPKHKAVLMEGVPFETPLNLNDNFTAICLETHDIGCAGSAECFVLNRRESEKSKIELAVHILDCNCGWSHELL